MNKFQNKYRNSSTRLQNWDYSWAASYFVTICTQNRIHYFGEIKNGEMELSPIGEIVQNEWLKTFEMRPDMNLEMGEFVVMPNHFHAIIGIGENEYNRGGENDTTGRRRDATGRDAMHCVPTTTVATTTAGNDIHDPTEPKNKFGPQSKNLASIIRGFKIGVTKNARLINPNFAWQARYHDHIIRNQESHQRISNYIVNNPRNWQEDTFYK